MLTFLWTVIARGSIVRTSRKIIRDNLIAFLLPRGKQADTKQLVVTRACQELYNNAVPQVNVLQCKNEIPIRLL